MRKGRGGVLGHLVRTPLRDRESRANDLSVTFRLKHAYLWRVPLGPRTRQAEASTPDAADSAVSAQASRRPRAVPATTSDPAGAPSTSAQSLDFSARNWAKGGGSCGQEPSRIRGGDRIGSFQSLKVSRRRRT